MTTFELLQVDAFTRQPLSGNPCAVIFETDNLDAATMQALAKEMNLSETAFVRESKMADFAVRYFTPAQEIPMAGHPTIATTFALFDTGRLALQGHITTIMLEMQVGLIKVEIISEGNQIRQIVMTQKKPRFLTIHDPDLVLPLFGLSSNNMLCDVPIQTVSTGTPQLMVPVQNLEMLQGIQLDVVAYSEYRSQSDFFSPHIFCLEGFSKEGSTFARHFGVPPDTPEDPFTGSATGGMAAYLWHYNLIKDPIFIAEQGHWMQRPGRAVVEVIGPRNDIHAIKVGGEAVTIFHGELTI